VFVRGNYQSDLTSGNAAFPDTPATAFWQHPYGWVVGHDWSINGTMTNNFRYGLTRQAFSSQGDSAASSISFRNVFSPIAFTRTLSRVSPTTNFSDDFTWIVGNHTLQIGGNVRIIRNARNDFGSAFDDAVTNPSFYDLSGKVVTNAFTNAGYTIDPGSISIVQDAATALIGRFSQYSGNFTFGLDGSVLPAGTPTKRNFATEEYDEYGQDIWKPFHNLTVTFGIRYSLDRPVYEKNGFEVVPTVPLGDFLERRKFWAATGVPLNELITFEKGGPANHGPGFYRMAWNNWQPSVAVAWSPNFKNGFLKAIFGENAKSVFRGGFRIVNDHFGEQLAVSFNALSAIGFTSSSTIGANTYNVTDRLAPQFTGFGQNIRTFPGIPAPTQGFTAPVTPGCLDGSAPSECVTRIETSLDSTIKTPTHYTWNISWGRQLPKGMYFEASYIGRIARNLLAARDVMALNDLVDRQSGMDWYAAANKLYDLRMANTPISSVAAIPYFEHLFPNIAGTFTGLGSNSTQEIYAATARDCSNNAPRDSMGNCPPGSVDIGGFDISDWTFLQSLLDGLGIYPHMFFHPQYGALTSFGSIANSNYNGATFSLRQRFGETLSYDFNYTWSKSFDLASGLQSGGSYGSQFILNALRPHDNYAFSDFDVRHSINANFIFQLPLGRGRTFFRDMNKYANVVLGGWQLAGIFRFNSGLPLSSPFDGNQWATNWNVQSNGTTINPLTLVANRSTRNAFTNPQAALNSFRNARPGETGQRNNFRQPGYSTLDLGLSKSFTMPWNENHKLAIRWEVINVMNYQYFNADNFTTDTYALGLDPQLNTVTKDNQGNPLFGQIYTSIQGNPRRMQFGLRYSF